ncbi:putative RNA-directed DNA polymerase from transposon X-element [Triplophysa tibetana]|uniref:Putative RNA-directed DNA polymerase from transposon X-element n=1 Tax=Triplophysa tibetana TaxID=1572043 RepID=A0A5A9PSL8_9TELE|nr:putative RNA-directed DNA polymerase from transposon X-element [Triplophysa tibetana]
MIKPKDNIFNEQNQRLKFGLLNIRSLNPKAVIVNEMITENSFDILCLTETWLKPNDYFGLNESTPPSYGYIHEPRPVGRGGGVAAIFRDYLTVTRRTMHTFKSFEMLALNITVPNKSKKSLVSLTLVIVYRPPGPYTNFLIEFADFLSDLLVNVDKVLIVGDFNIHVDSPNDPLAVVFKELLDSCGVTQYINRPTHRLNHTLDLIISHGADLTNIDIIPQSDDVSDHYLITCTLRTAEISCISRYRQGRTITSTTKDSFVKNLPDLTPLITFPTNIESLDDMTSNMGTIFSNTLEAVAPMKSKRINEKIIAPWYNNTTRALKRETRKLERKCKQTQLEVFKIAWKESASCYKKALKAAKAEHFRNLIENNKNNPRFLFSTIAKLTNKQTPPDLGIPPHLGSNEFMKFFTEKIEIIRDHIAKTKPQSVTEELVSPVNQKEKLQCFSPINQEDLIKIIATSKPTTCLLDPIPTTLLKELLPAAIEPICNIINSSINLGHVPGPFKLAVIKPLIKKPNLDPNELGSYRPISNLPYLSKILEKVVSTQLCTFLQNNDMHEKFQSGFRPYHSTETALVRITNDLLIASDKGNISLLVLLDLSAAFDTVDHKILLDRLHNYIGIQGQALQWFRSYLTDRYQYVHLKGKSSYLTQVNYGLPQGSVLGPLLFSIYMLPLGNIIRKHEISFHCYADDTQLYISSRPDDSFKLSKLAECIEDIKHWMTSNFLLLNSNKTEILLIAPKTDKQNISDYSLQIEGCTVTSTNTVKDLGVILDGNLSFKNHISNITKTAFFHLRNVSKLRNIL